MIRILPTMLVSVFAMILCVSCAPHKNTAEPTAAPDSSSLIESSTTSPSPSPAPTPTPVPASVFDLEARSVMLNSGHAMPVIGLGTWTMTNEQAEECVYHALKCGVRLIDTARYYQCEQGVGKGVRKAIDEGLVKREDVFITTKIQPNDFDRPAEAIDESLADLDCGYIDLMLIHAPGNNDKEVYRAMEDAVREGKLHSIGISNYYTKLALDKVLSYAEILPAVIQIENHIFAQNKELKEYASQYGIVINSYYPFGGRGNTQELFGNEVIAELAEKYERTSAQIILRWHMQAGYIAIPGSTNPDHIEENYNVFDFELTDDDMERIGALDEQRRYAGW